MKSLLISMVFVSIAFLGWGQSITTDSTSNTTQTTVTLHATASSLDAAKTYFVKFYWDTAGTSITSSSPNGQTGTYTGGTSHSFSYDVTGLKAGGHYHFNAYLYEDAFPDAIYKGSGTDYNFTMLSTTVPSVTIASSITNITKTDADCDGNTVDDDGGASITDYGICWSTSSTPTTSDNKYSAGSSGTPVINYNAQLSSLSAGTKYYVRAYAVNSQGTGYSSTTRNFITNTDNPSIDNESNVEATSFTANWHATTGAQGYYLDVATDDAFNTYVAGYQNKDVGNVTSHNVTGLSATTDYWYRVRAYHDGGDDGAAFTSGNSSSNKVTTVTSEPSTQASGIKYETISGNMHITWTDGNGANRIVIMRNGSACQDPVSGETYSANSAFGSGDDVPNGSGSTYCVFNSSGAKASDVTVSNLTGGNDYYFEILEYNGTGSSTNYNTTTSTGWNSGNSASSQLPITLAEFNAEIISEGVQLEWKTATELNNNYFVIQRSTDGIEFEDVSRINGAGTSNVLTEYGFTDVNAPEGVVYYRLMQVDYDGTFAFSSIIYVDTKNDNGIVNITKVIAKDNSIDVYVNKTTDASSVLSLYTLNGKLIQGVVLGQKGGRVLNLDMSNYAHGVYFIKVQTGDKTISKKIVY